MRLLGLCSTEEDGGMWHINRTLSLEWIIVQLRRLLGQGQAKVSGKTQCDPSKHIQLDTHNRAAVQHFCGVQALAFHLQQVFLDL